MDHALDYFSMILLGFAGILCFAMLCLLFLVIPEQFMREAARDRSPKALMSGGVFAVAVLAAIGALMGMMFGMIADLQWRGFSSSPILLGTLVTAGVFAIIGAIVCFAQAGVVASSIRRQKELAPRVAAYALANFDMLSAGRLCITLETMKQVQVSGEQAEYVDQLRSYLSDIGHVVDTYTTTQTSVLVSAGVIIPRTTTTTHNVYGASKADLDSYPARIAATYSRW